MLRKFIKRKQKKINNPKDSSFNMLKRDLEIIDLLIKETGDVWEYKHPIFSLIDNIMMNEGSARVLKLTSSDETSAFSTFQYYYYFEELGIFDNRKTMSVEEMKYAIDFSEEFIMTNVWKRERLIRNLAYINSGKPNMMNETLPWKYQYPNHFVTFAFPMSIAQTNNGNHSTLPGVLRRYGLSYFSEIEDYSNVYEQVYFDGINFVSKNGMKKSVNYLEGLAFEIGRVLLSNPKLFDGHPQKQMLKDYGFL